MKKNRHGKAAIFKPHEIKKIRKAFTQPHHRAIFEIALYTGERMGAILKLEKSDVYFVDGQPLDIITFQARNRKGSKGKKETRQVIVHPELKSFLENYQSERESSYLFPSPRDADKPISYDVVYQYWRTKFDSLGLDHRGFSCHSTRRSFITQLVANGIDLKTVQEITGHRDTKVLLGYVEADEKRTRRAIATLQV